MGVSRKVSSQVSPEVSLDAALAPPDPTRSPGRYLVRSGCVYLFQIKMPQDIGGRPACVVLDFSRPGKPTDNSFIESFNGKFRAECLNAHWFLTLDDARQKMEHWRRDYNEVRPHSAIGNKPPISLMNGSGASHPS